ncbi:MAG: hypothetical protein WAN12_09970 [Candidatus Acidiferrum sp.]|jgi:hypothetical protein
MKLAKLRETEYQFDHLDSQSRERSEAKPPSFSRDTRQADLLAQRERTEIRDRDRCYSLRPSEIHTLTEVGKFRVVALEDLTNCAYSGDRSRLDSDLRNLVRQRLVERRCTSPFKKESHQLLTLTKRGERFVRGFLPDDQAIYSGFVKPKEADHDVALYRLYEKAAAEIERNGGKVLRVQLDYELKEKLYRKLGQARTQGERQAQGMKEAFARQLYLPVVHEKVSFPDLRIEYTTQEMEIARVDLELATSHYHAGHLAEKARAGFQIYARSADAPGLRRVRDDREIMTAILSL